MTTVGRNDPCPCGSGMKYKKCCLAKPPSSDVETDGLIDTKVAAFKAMSQRKWEEALGLFKSLVDSAPDRPKILEAMAACCDGLEDYLMAAEMYEKALAECSSNSRFELTYRLGVARGCAGRPQKAKRAFEECLSLPEGAENADGLHQIIRTLDDIVAGKQDASCFLVQVQMQRALTDMDEDRFDDAAVRLERIALLEPDNATIYYNLGIANTFLKKEDLAIEHFRRTVEINPRYAQAWYNMGQICLLKKRDYSQALHCFGKAASVRPDYIGAHHQRGVAYELLGDQRKAVECWEKTLELDPDNAQAKESILRVRESSLAKDEPTDHP